MAKVLRCGDLMAGCNTVIEGKDVAEVLAKGAAPPPPALSPVGRGQGEGVQSGGLARETRHAQRAIRASMPAHISSAQRAYPSSDG
jgi:hypothetical protein